MKRGLFCLVALLLPAAAHAHGISPAIKGFYAGGMMVLNGPEDLLQWVALGAFAAIHPAKQAGWVAEALVAGLGAGCLGLAGSVPLWANAVALLTVGTLLVAGVRLPFAALGGLAAGIGLLHGAHAGADMATLPDKLAVAAGVGITAYVFMVVCLATLVWLQLRFELCGSSHFARSVAGWLRSR
jgi:hydrogenase/urease accessory protein HupE